MNWIDLLIFITYMLAMLGVGIYFFRKNTSLDDYYVGSRSMSKYHLGLSVVATDVGGGFSIGLGGLGFVMGIAGSWMLFTGLVGAWLSAVLLIPKVYELSGKHQFLTFPQFLKHHYSKPVAVIAGIISVIGYTGFTSSQLLAGAKLASASFINLNINTALIIMGVIAVMYTFLGGLKAVIYTDTIQWIVLMVGLIFVAIPFSYFKVGGISAIREYLAPEYLSLGNIKWQTLLNWFVTIVPIWFVGMTLYQRIYSAKSKKEAQKGWYIAGLFEYPIMAFMGVFLGMMAKVGYEQGLFQNLVANTQFDAEMGLPMLLRTILPPGLMGLILASYFSAILSTADSCLMAASGNLVTDIIGTKNKKNSIRFSQIFTLVIGIIALFIALKVPDVLDLMLKSYAFMVSGMFVPVITALFFNSNKLIAALVSMILGGGTTLLLISLKTPLPFGLDPIIFGLTASALGYFLTWIFERKVR